MPNDRIRLEHKEYGEGYLMVIFREEDECSVLLEPCSLTNQTPFVVPLKECSVTGGRGLHYAR